MLCSRDSSFLRNWSALAGQGGAFPLMERSLESIVKYRSLLGSTDDRPHVGDPRQEDWSCTGFQ